MIHGIILVDGPFNVMKEELLNLCPQLQFPQDEKLIQLCSEDMMGYADFIHAKYTELESETQDVLNYNGAVIGNVKTNNIDFSLGVPLYEDITKETTDFIKMFTKQWWHKYQTRTKVVTELPKNGHEIINPYAVQAANFTNEEKEQIILEMRQKFMQYGEICCTQPLAHNLLSTHIRNSRKINWTTEDKINLKITLLRLVKQMAYTHGPLLFIKQDFNKTNIREFRDDNATKIM